MGWLQGLMIILFRYGYNKALYKRRKQSVEPVFGVLKSVLGFTQFSLRGIEKVKAEWQLLTLAYNCKRLAKLAV